MQQTQMATGSKHRRIRCRPHPFTRPSGASHSGAKTPGSELGIDLTRPTTISWRAKVFRFIAASACIASKICRSNGGKETAAAEPLFNCMEERRVGKECRCRESAEQ